MKTRKFPLLAIALIVGLALLTTACLKNLELDGGGRGNNNDLVPFTLSVIRPDRVPDLDFTKVQVIVSVQNRRDNLTFKAPIKADGTVTFHLEPAMYTVTVEGEFWDEEGELIDVVGGLTGDFLLTENGIVLENGDFESAERTVQLRAFGFEPDIPLVIREFYFGGDLGVIAGSTYQTDQYVEIYNNGSRDVVLDGIFIGAIWPHNSTSQRNAWSGRDTLPVIPGQFMIPPLTGGRPRILKPGESIVIALSNAIDLTGVTQNGLRLNKAHLVTHIPQFTSRAAAPGVERMRLVTDTELRGTAWAMSVGSPAFIIYQIPNLTRYLMDEHIWVKHEPGRTDGWYYRHICVSWIIDAVEVFANPTDPSKRLPASVDISFIRLPNGIRRGDAIRRVVRRTTDEGRVIYRKTNNSAMDFEVVRPNPRLRED